MNRLLTLVALSAFVAPMAEAAQNGNVRGQVTDDGGLSVPGAMVELTSAELPQPLQATTDEDGNFRFLSVPPGAYKVTVTKSGLNKTTLSVSVRLDETAFVPIVLKVGGEEITVTAAPPVIDATRSSVSAELSYESLTQLPVGRSYQDVVNILPGISGRVDTQEGGPGNGNPSVRGEGQYGNNYLVDGASTRDPATKTFGTNVNFDAIDDIQVYTDGAPAEFGEATGMLVNVVTKSGGDEHHGSAAFFFSHDASFGTYMIADLDKGKEVATEKRKFSSESLSLTAGGPIIKQRLWYFAALDLGLQNATFEGMNPDTPYNAKDAGGFAKLSFFATPDITLRYQFNGQFQDIDNYNTSSQFTSESQAQYNSTDMSHMLTFEWRPAALSLLEFKLLYNASALDVVPMSGDEDTPAIVNVDTGEYSGNWTDFDLNRRGRMGGTLQFTQLVDKALGHHAIKAGVEGWNLTDSRELIYTGPGEGMSYFASADRPCVTQDFSDCEGYTEYHEAGAIGHRGLIFAGFLQDDWQPVRSLTINVGVRVDHEQLYQNDGDLILAQTMPAPRLGIAWDITNDSKTVLTLNAGRYYDINGNTFADWGDSRSAFWFDEYAYNPDTDAYDLVWSQNPELQPLVYCTEQSVADYKDYLLSLGYTQDDLGPVDTAFDDICNGTLRPYHMDKAVLGLKRELFPLFAVGVRGIFSQTVDLPEDVDYDLNTWLIANPASKRRDYWAVEATAERKFDGHWQALASYTYSHAKGTMPGQFELASGGQTGSDGNQVGVYNDDVNDLDTRAMYFDAGYGWLLDGLAGLGTESDDAGYYGYLPYHSFHSLKLNGSYTFSFGTTIGAVYEFDSGHAWQKRGYVELYQDYFAMPEGRGSRFMPAVHYFDLHLGHSFDFKKGRGIELALDVFNVLDLAAPITYYENDNENFGLTLYRQEPRSIRAMVKGRY